MWHMILTPKTWQELWASTNGLKSADASLDANVQHLIHVLVGYRETIIDPEVTNADTPFSPDSARDGSWQTGRELALADLKKRTQ